MSRLGSERVVVQAPMSFTGSAKRIWRLGWDVNRWVRWLLVVPGLLLLVVLAWTVVAVWYVAFGLLLVPYRLVRRGSRRERQDALRHREALNR